MIDWTDPRVIAQLGMRPDREVAHALGCSPQIVHRHRNALGIASHRTLRRIMREDQARAAAPHPGIGHQLKIARVTAGRTQEQAADLAGVTRQRWGQLEAGNIDSLRRLQSLVAAIGAEVQVLITAPE